MMFQVTGFNAGGTFFGDMLQRFESLGGYEIVLPFLLVFTVLFALLQKIKILGEDKKNLNVILSLILSLIFITQTQLVNYLYSFLPKVSLVVLVGIMLLMLMGLFSRDNDAISFAHGIAVVLAVVGLVWALIPGSLMLNWPRWLMLGGTDKAVILTIALFVIVIWVVGKEPKSGDGFGEGAKKFVKGFGDMLKGGD